MRAQRSAAVRIFTAAAWVACCFQHNRRINLSAVLRLGRSVYPFLQSELFLPWDEDGFVERVRQTVDLFVAEGLIKFKGGDEGDLAETDHGGTVPVARSVQRHVVVASRRWRR